jgi:hypothetical protein
MRNAIGIGYLLVVLGVAFVIIAILVWLGVVTPGQGLNVAAASWADVAIALIKTVPWVALVGLALIYAGLRTLGVKLSPG